MATIAPGGSSVTAERSERRFFMFMLIAMAATIVAGFSLNIATGRSSFASPAIVHAHGITFMGWIALVIAQAVTIATGRREMHIRLGKLAYVWIPAMAVLGLSVMVHSARTRGGPPFFALNEFMISNSAMLLCFAGLALWALRRRRHDGWHRRLIVCAMTALTGPGLGRLLPTPLFIPWSWTVVFLVTLVFPLIAVVADKRRLGHVHAAYRWGFGIYIGTFIASMVLAYSPVGIAITKAVVAGTPGAERPLEAFLPPGFLD